MKKYIFILFSLILITTSCYYLQPDPLKEVRKLARSNEIEKKKDAAKYYELIIKLLAEAYSANASINKSLGQKLMFHGDYINGIKHLELSKQSRISDADIYFWLGVCYINLYKVNKPLLKMPNNEIKAEEVNDYLLKAEEHYLIALEISPKNKEINYSYAQLLVYAKEDYVKAKEVLINYVYNLAPKLKIKPRDEIFKKFTKKDTNEKTKINPDVNALFLLGHVYYALEEYQNALNTYEIIFNDYKNSLKREDKIKLDGYIAECVKLISNE